MNNNATVDVIIPIYKPGNEFEEVLKRLKSQTITPNRIILMHTVSENYRPYWHADEKIEIYDLNKEDFDHGGTRDEAIRMSEADYVLLMTQDAVPQNMFLIEKLLKAFEDEKVGVCYARQLPRNDCNVIEKFTRSFNYPSRDLRKTSADIKSMGIKTFFCSDVCAMYRRRTYLSLGGFVHPVIFNEDMIMASRMIKAGYAVYYSSDAEVIHSHNYNFKEQYKRNFDLAVSQAMHPEVFEGISSESEGIKMVKATFIHLWRIGKPWLVFRLITSSAAKYLGYRKGKNYEKLSMDKIMKYTSNPCFWNK